LYQEIDSNTRREWGFIGKNGGFSIKTPLLDFNRKVILKIEYSLN